jgi:hypothetical protein
MMLEFEQPAGIAAKTNAITLLSLHFLPLIQILISNFPDASYSVATASRYTCWSPSTLFPHRQGRQHAYENSLYSLLVSPFWRRHGTKKGGLVQILSPGPSRSLVESELRPANAPGLRSSEIACAATLLI